MNTIVREGFTEKGVVISPDSIASLNDTVKQDLADYLVKYYFKHHSKGSITLLQFTDIVKSLGLYEYVNWQEF